MRDVAKSRTRSFAAGNATFVVNCPSERVKAVVEALFADLPDGRDSTIDRVITISEGDDDTLCVQSGDEARGPYQRPNNLLATLVTTATRLSLDCEPERLHIHCAGLELGGQGVLISAASGTGKTTLAAKLLSRRWTYLSDESVAIESDTSVAVGFAKPLMIKPGSRELLPELGTYRVSLDLEDDMFWHVPASAMSARIIERVEPSLIVLLHHSADERTGVAVIPTRIERADAVVALMGHTMDAERFGPDAVIALARLVARCTCIWLPVGPLDSSAELLEALVATSSGQTDVLPLDDPGESALAGWRIPDTVRSVMIDGRVVAHDTAGGSIVALDEVGSGVWAAIFGAPPDWWQPQVTQTSATDSFLRHLASMRLLIPPDHLQAEVSP